jgi:hypothetical protein
LKHEQPLRQTAEAQAPYPKVVSGMAGLDVPIERRSGKDRRKLSPWSLLYGGFRPRRRRGRRHEDHEYSWLDWHEPSVLYLSVAIVLLSCVDALFTLNLLAVGGEELNVFMDEMIGRGADRFLLVKIGLTSVSVILLGVAARRRFLGLFRVSRILEVTCAGYALLICYEIFLLLRFLEDSGAEWSLLGAGLTLG